MALKPDTNPAITAHVNFVHDQREYHKRMLKLLAVRAYHDANIHIATGPTQQAAAESCRLTHLSICAPS